MVPKNFGTPLAHGRKVFGTVSNHVLTPAVHPQERKLHKPQVGTNLSICILSLFCQLFFSHTLRRPIKINLICCRCLHCNHVASKLWYCIIMTNIWMHVQAKWIKTHKLLQQGGFLDTVIIHQKHVISCRKTKSNLHFRPKLRNTQRWRSLFLMTL